MVFFHQLRLLLWKNFTLKKRAPHILLIELVVPLVLFLILVFIRNHRSPYKSNTERWHPDALPSAGFIPLLQSFCRGGSVMGKDGYKMYPNASINKILGDIVDITNTPVFSAALDLKALQEDFQTFENDVNMSQARVISNIKFSDLLSNKSGFELFLSRNLSMPNYLVEELMTSQLNGSKLTQILLEKRYDLLNTFLERLQHQHLPTAREIKELQQSIILQSLFDPTALHDGPPWMRLLSKYGGIPGFLTGSVNMTSVEKFVKDVFLNTNEVHQMICGFDNNYDMLVMKNKNLTEKHALKQFLCNMSQEHLTEFAQQLKVDWNWNNTMKLIHFDGPSMERMFIRSSSIRNDLTKLENIEEAVTLLSKLSKDMQLNITKIENRVNESRSHQNIQNVNDLWNVLSPILCGTPPPASKNNEKADGSNLLPQLLQGSKEATHALKIMLYMLSHDPMILYSPNGTQADEVIKKSSRILDLLKASKDIAIQWKSLTKKFHKIILSNETQKFLQKLSLSVDKFPFLYDYNFNASFFDSAPDEIQHYIESHNATLYEYLTKIRPHFKNVISAIKTDESGHNELVRQLNSVDVLAKGWLAILHPMKLDIFYGFPNETMLNQFVVNKTSYGVSKKQPILSAIIFDNIEKNGLLPKHIFYRIRMDGRLLFTTQRVRSRYWTPGPRSGNSKYFYFGFTWLQDQVERAMIEVLTNKNVSAPGLYVQEIPYPCYLEDNFMFVIQYIMPLCTVVSFIYSVAIIVQSIVYEKEQRLKEVMKMMGLSNAVHWTSWFITSCVTMTFIVILLTVILKTGKILQYSNTGVILLFLTLAAIATINFCFLISIFFSKAKLAAACGGIIYFVTYMPYVFISIQEGGSNHVYIDSSYKTLASLLSTTAFGLGARYFALFEQNGVGVHWHNIASSPLENDDFNLAQVFTMLLVDILLYTILVWYIEAIHPGEFGIPRPWYFPFQLSYWFGWNTQCNVDLCQVYNRLRTSSHNNGEPPNTPALLAMEAEPTHLKLGVFIDNLMKTYKSGARPAVDHLSLNLYEGQITSFLGHNGAGKTTTMSLLTGLFPPSSGTAYIYGNDIHSDMDKIRTSLGMCPQHNVLYDRLTVDEHLWFYARLKGMPIQQVNNEMDRILEDIGLPEKRNKYVETLSGGMKRKLSVAMAFVGGSQTVILDEPTAGVDPFARRAIWELLAKYKDGRTILLSTHFMDEADILGDRIAIISHGKLRCCGSSSFLKKKFGDGYHLTLVKETNSKDNGSNSITESTTQFVQEYVPSAQFICETPYELSFILPDKGKDKKGMLKRLFESLEKNKEKLKCKSFGLQDTTLEEVFLKVTEATVAGEDTPQELTTSVNLLHSSPSSTIPSDESAASPISSPAPSDKSKELTFEEIMQSPPLGDSIHNKNKRNGHRRSFSTDFLERKLSKKTPSVCKHRRTPSGSFCGHRRALSSDLSFVLQASGASSSSDQKSNILKHRRVPSGVSKLRPVGGEAWQSNVGGMNTVNSNMRRWMQFYGLLLKRFHHSRRNLKALLTHILLPGLFVSIAMTVALSQPKVDTYPPLVLSPTMFHPSPYYIPYSNSKHGSDNMSDFIAETFHYPSGVGSDCVLKSENTSFDQGFTVKQLRSNLDFYFDDFCKDRVGLKTANRKALLPITKSDKDVRHSGKPICQCDKRSWTYACGPGAGGNPEKFQVVTTDTMVHVKDNQSFEDYLLYTNNKYRRMRYGALTVGDVQELVPLKVRNSRYPDVQKLYARDSAKVWFSNKGYHAMPTFINVMDNAILRAMITPDMGNPAAYGITAISHPFNFTKNVLNLDSIKQGTDAIIAIFVIISMSFVPASFVCFLVMERTTKAKHLQFVSGVNPILYWLSNYVWDLINFLIPIAACMVIFQMFNVPAYASKSNFPAVCALFICYGWSITPMMYPASFLFKEASTAYVVLIILNLFLGITCTVTTSILQLFPNDPQLTIAFDIVKTVSLIFPNYCLGRGLMDLAYNELMNMVYSLTGQFDLIRSPFEWDIVTRNLVFMLSEGFFFFILTIIIEYRRMLKRKTVLLVDNTVEGEDIDVSNERERVLAGGAEDGLLRIENLTKIYNSRKTGKHLAVNRLCLGVSKGECFGLLGVNGAGKTTTFKMLTGDIGVTAGDAFIENRSIVRDTLQVHSKIGYCPQFDALIDSLTAEEHLYFYGRLKGIPELELKDVTSFLIRKMALSLYANKPAMTYSGGNKRKLSAAIALLGNPSVIFMDEPTTGMDPGARRFLWNVILSIIQEGSKSVVLTSHSMEECEALCTRLAIMVNGKFKCLGSTQHIKNRFGDGYIVVVRVKGSLPNMGPIQMFMEEQFANSILKERHHNVVQYQIPSSENISLSIIFDKMESISEELLIEDYSVSQTSLDNVFVNFAKYQQDSTEENDPSFMYSNKTGFQTVKRKWHQYRDQLQCLYRNKRVTRFTELVQTPPIADLYETTEPTGAIGDDEEEVELEDADTFGFPLETTRLTFNV